MHGVEIQWMQLPAKKIALPEMYAVASTYCISYAHCK